MSTIKRVSTVLVQVREKITDPKHWTQYTLARFCNGQECKPTHDLAVSWCVIGAFESVAANPDLTERAQRRLLTALDAFSLMGINDTGRRKYAHSRLLVGLDKAIAKARLYEARAAARRKERAK